MKLVFHAIMFAVVIIAARNQGFTQTIWNQNGTAIYTSSANNAGIGTTTPDTKLTVNGKIHTGELKINLNVPAPDYVFNKDYNLMSIQELEKYIIKNKHLPEIPSAKEMEQCGLNLSEMSMHLLKKTEELTLYLINHEKRISNLEKKLMNQ
jgi:hypothetical protein